jgi:dTDP-4-dehydrorhamnose reductase
VDKAEEEKELAFAVNCDGVENLALACKAQDIPLIHISTDYVFDGDKEQPYLESDLPNPTSVYGSSKLAGEKILQAVWSKHFIVRVSWVFGSHGANFVKTMLRSASQRDELAVVADQFGAPTAATDIARVLLNLAVGAESNYGLYHLESNPAISWHGFASHIFEQAQAQGLLASQPLVKPIASDQFPTPVKRPANSKLATENGLAAVSWPDSLAAMLARWPREA